MGIEQDLRAEWDIAPLRGLWQRAREALESPSAPPTFRLELPDDETRRAVGELYGRPLWGDGTRINVSKLDAAVRASRFGLGLREVVEILHDSPVQRADSAEALAEKRHAAQYEAFRRALAAHGLERTAWAATWCTWVCQFGRVAEDDQEAVARQAAAVLAETAGDPARRGWTWRAELAARAGAADLLDEGTTLSRVVLRGLAEAHGLAAPSSERERRAVWGHARVASDGVSDTVLCWALPWESAEMAAPRARAGAPSHVTLADLRAAPDPLVAPGTPVAVCENPRVLEAALAAGVHHPLVAVDDGSSPAAQELLRRLFTAGARVRVHADFDWAGLRVAAALHAEGAQPWRLGSADYRAALDRAAAERRDLGVLSGQPVATPWDPQLSELLGTAGRTAAEEAVLPELLEDLRTGLE
ncbi:DUF2399 domain-containing protein [Salinifilum ghardaiensis]